MITPEQILELAKTCGFEEFIGEKDDETDGVYYQFWEEQMIDFAQQIRRDTLYEVIHILSSVPNPEANRTAINRITMELD
jgi:hypothetical protein